MKAIEVQGSFGLDKLVSVEREVIEPGPGQLRLRMTAACLNYRDLLTVQGLYNPKQPLPLIPGSDGVGVIEALGEGVQGFELGQRVATCFFQNWTGGDMPSEALLSTLGGPLDGTFCESMTLSEKGVIAVPEHLSDAEAATLPCAALTAWSALRQSAVKAGDTVLLLGTGGVSIFALQFAVAMGARVIITSSRADKLERARSLGAWKTINYKTDPKWGATAKDICGGRGVDCVVEVGGSQTLSQSLAALRPGGTMALIGVLSGLISDFNVIPVIMQGLRIQGIIVGHRDGFADMNRALEAHSLKPVVDKEFALDEAKAAFEFMAAGKHFGKIVLKI